MATMNPLDLIATLEKRLADAWPWAGVAMTLIGRDGPASNAGVAVEREVCLQEPVLTPRPTRAGEDWQDVDFRAVCYSTVNDPHDATRMAADLREILRNAHWSVLDRSDGTTVVGYVEFHETEVQPAGRDGRGRRVASVRATGWAGTV